MVLAVAERLASLAKETANAKAMATELEMVLVEEPFPSEVTLAIATDASSCKCDIEMGSDKIYVRDTLTACICLDRSEAVASCPALRTALSICNLLMHAHHDVCPC
jgi:hypothetical protein